MFRGATPRESPLRLPAHLPRRARALVRPKSPELPPLLGPAGTAWRGRWRASGATEGIGAPPTQGGFLDQTSSSAPGAGPFSPGMPTRPPWGAAGAGEGRGDPAGTAA